jgi:hypothetical protein
VKLAAGEYDFEWFDPAKGEVAKRGTVLADGKEKVFAAPFEGDAVLYVKAERK